MGYMSRQPSQQNKRKLQKKPKRTIAASFRFACTRSPCGRALWFRRSPVAFLHTLTNGDRHAVRQPPAVRFPPRLLPPVRVPSVPCPEPGPQPGRWPDPADTPPMLGSRGRRRRGQEGVGSAGSDAAGAAGR